MENILRKEPIYLTPKECARQFADDILEVCFLFFFF